MDVPGQLIDDGWMDDERRLCCLVSLQREGEGVLELW